MISITAAVCGIALYLIFSLASQRAQNSQKPAFPDTPFQLPDGSTAYPQGTLATHLDSPERKQNASLLIWPDPLLDWLNSFWTRYSTQTPKTLVSVSEQSNFVLIQVENLPHRDPYVRERRIANFTLLAIEPHVNASAEQLGTMKVRVNGEPTTIVVDHEIHRPPQSTMDSLSQMNPEFASLSALQIRVEMSEEVYVTGDYKTLLQIEFEDNAGKNHQDQIEAEFRIN